MRRCRGRLKIADAEPGAISIAAKGIGKSSAAQRAKRPGRIFWSADRLKDAERVILAMIGEDETRRGVDIAGMGRGNAGRDEGRRLHRVGVIDVEALG